MDNDAKFICDRLRQATDDFTSLGRWGWGILIVFMTQILLQTAAAKGALFQSLGCDPGSVAANEIARSFLLIVVISAVVYWWFLFHARRKVVTARSAVFDLNAKAPSPSLGLAFVVKSAPTDSELRLALAFRFAIIAVFLIVWVMIFEPSWPTLVCMVGGVSDYSMQR